MRKFLVYAGLLASLTSGAQASGIKWNGNFDSALAMGKSSHRLLMVDFWATWCSGCKLLDKNTYTAGSVIDRSNSFIPVKLNAMKEGIPVVVHYNIKAFPTVLFVKPSGELVWKIEGYVPPAEFIKQMKLADQVGIELPQDEALYRKNGSSPELDLKLVEIYAGTANLPKMGRVLEDLEKHLPAGPSSLAGQSFNTGGDTYQLAQKLPEAIHCYRMAEETGKPHEMAYARLNLANCYLSNGDVDSARPVLQALVAMGPEADHFRKQAQSLLNDMGAKKGG